MSVYKYNMYKYVKSWSTWIILGVALIIAFISGFLPFAYMKTDRSDSAMKYAVIIVATVAGMTSFVSIFVSVFAGFKAAQMFKDEVEDGTFLVMLSKPITRSRLIFFKWLALQTILLLFTFLISLTYGIAVAIFDKGDVIHGLNLLGIHTLTSKLGSVMFLLWAILSLSGLIFSSIALLLSTKLTVGTTIGISIAFGVVIPITGIIGMFTRHSEYYSLQNNNLDFLNNSISKIEDMSTKNMSAMKNQMKDFSIEYKKMFKKIKSDPKSVYSMGLKTGESDGFKKLWPFDLQYHVSALSTLASDNVVPGDLKENLDSMTHDKGIYPSTIKKVNGGVNSLEKDATKRIKNVIAQVENSINGMDKVRNDFFKNGMLPVIFLSKEKVLIGSKKNVEVSNSDVMNIQKSMIAMLVNYFEKKTKIVINPNIKNKIWNKETPFTAMHKILKLLFTSNQNSALKHNLKNQVDKLSKILGKTTTDLINTLIGKLDIDKLLKDFESKITQKNPNLNNLKITELMKSVISLDTTSNKGSKLNISQKELGNLLMMSSFLILQKGTYIDSITHNYLDKDIKDTASPVLKSYLDFLDHLTSQLPKNDKLGTTTNTIKMMVHMQHQLQSPLSSLLISTQNIHTYIKENNIDSIKMDNSNIAKIIKKKTNVNSPQSLHLSQGDKNVLKDLLSIVKVKKDTYVKIEHVAYANKYLILSFYLILAIVLVPVSYLLVRKQDFR